MRTSRMLMLLGAALLALTSTRCNCGGAAEKCDPSNPFRTLRCSNPTEISYYQVCRDAGAGGEWELLHCDSTGGQCPVGPCLPEGLCRCYPHF